MEINVLFEGGFEGCPEVGWLQRVAEQALTVQGADSDVELGLVITSQERVKQLNKSYRGKDEPTDVLAFYMTSAAGETFVAPPDGVRHLGEVIISYPQAVLQAKEHRHSIKKELTILIIHGVLHLLGYDHEEPGQERQMRGREAETLNYIEEKLNF